MDDYCSLDSVIQDLASQIEPTKTKAKKKVKKKKQNKPTTCNNENYRELKTPDLPSDMEFSFDAPIYRPVLRESANHMRVAPRDFQSLAVDDDLLAALKELELSGHTNGTNNSDDNLSDILADLDDSPVTVKKRPLVKKKAKTKTKTKTSRKNILRPQLGSTSTPNNENDSNLLIPKIETQFDSPQLMAVSTEQLSDSGTHGSSDVLFSSCSDVHKTSHESGLKADSCLGKLSNLKTERSPINLDLPDLSLGSLSSKPSSPGLSSTRRSVQDDSYDLAIEMSRISKFSNHLESGSSNCPLDDTELLESSEEPIKFPRKLITKKLDDTELLESSNENRIDLEERRKRTDLRKLDDTEILESYNEKVDEFQGRTTTVYRNFNDTDILEDGGDGLVEMRKFPKLMRVAGVESQSEQQETDADDGAMKQDNARPQDISDGNIEPPEALKSDRCVQADFSLLSTDSDRQKSVDEETSGDLDLDLNNRDDVFDPANDCYSDDNNDDSEFLIDQEVQADFSRLSSASSVDSENVLITTAASNTSDVSNSSRTISPEVMRKASPEQHTFPHKLSFSESPRPTPVIFEPTANQPTIQLSSSDEEDNFEQFLTAVRDTVKEEVIEDVVSDEDDFIVSDSEDVVCITSSEDDRSSSAERPLNPYLTPPEYPSPSPSPITEVTPTELYTSPRQTAFKTPRERVVRFSSDSDDESLPDLAGSSRLSPPRPLSTTPASVYKTARPPRNRPRLLSNRSRSVVTFSSSASEDEVVLDNDDVFKQDKKAHRTVPTIRSNSTSNLLSTPTAPLPVSLRQKGGKTVSSIQMGKLPTDHDHYDFLKSLGKEVPPQKIHPEALKYVRNFKHTKDELSQKLFRVYNQQVFDNKLRDRVPIIWNKRLTQTAGYCVNARDKTSREHTSRIELSTKVCDSAERIRDTLLHELCHAATWLLDQRKDGHGPFWKRWARLAHLQFPQLPMVTRCHSYYIETKFIYRCRKCGYSVNRHSKSLNTARKVCGICRGEFDLYSRQKDGSLSRVSDVAAKTPLNKFAQFVKDNYGSVKNVSKTKKHRDVMHILSAEFAASKIQT